MYKVDKPGVFPVGTIYQGYHITAAAIAEYQGLVNGYPCYVIAGEDENGNAVTWMASFQRDDNSDQWYVTTFWGHYFHGERDVTYLDSDSRDMETVKMTASRRAIYDLNKRVGISTDILACIQSEV